MARKIAKSVENIEVKPDEQNGEFKSKIRSRMFVDGTVTVDLLTTQPKTTIKLEGVTIPTSVAHKILNAIDAVLAENGL